MLGQLGWEDAFRELHATSLLAGLRAAETGIITAPPRAWERLQVLANLRGRITIAAV